MDEAPEPIELEAVSEDAAPSPESRRKRAWLIIILTVVLIALLVFAWRWRHATPAATPETEAEVVVSVKTAKATRQPIAAEVSAVGTIFPREQVTVSANINGQIAAMRLLKNAVVRRGETIATLDLRDLQAQRAEAVAALQEANINLRATRTSAIPQTNTQQQKDLADATAAVNNARAVYERRKKLYDQGGLALKDLQDTQLTLTNAENNLKFVKEAATISQTATKPNDIALANSKIQQAQQRIKTLDAQLSFANIPAPLTGIVTDQFQFQGEYATAGGRLVTIADISEVIVKAQFADSVVDRVEVGDAVTVLPTDAPDERLGGKVTLISRSSDAANRTVEIWVNLGNGAGRLRVGGAANVVIGTQQQQNAVVVPTAAVTLDAANEKTGVVMVVDEESVAHETKVEIGLKTAEFIQITSGLEGDETVVIEGNYALPDGTKVEEKKEETEGEAEK